MARTPSILLVAMATAGIVGLFAIQTSRSQVQNTFTGDIKSVLYVTNVEASAAFYRDVLGFGFDGFANRQDGTPYYAEMLAGVRKFGLHEPTVEGQESRIGQARLYFRVLDLEAHHRRVSDAGATTGEIFHRDWMDMFIVKDADGHEIVFAVTDPERHTSDPWMARIE